MPYLNEGKKTIAQDGVKPQSSQPIKMAAPVRIPPPATSKSK
jgi:hypothetical protein